MTVGKIMSSVLKAGIDKLPADAKVPAQSVPNLLKKQGVKEEEIKFSGVKLPTSGSVTKADLQKMESERLDIFNVEEVNNYNWVSLKPGRNNPTYKEKVTTFSDKGAQPRNASQDIEELQSYMSILERDAQDAEWDNAAREMDSRSIDLGRDPDAAGRNLGHGAHNNGIQGR